MSHEHGFVNQGTTERQETSEKSNPGGHESDEHGPPPPHPGQHGPPSDHHGPPPPHPGQHGPPSDHHGPPPPPPHFDHHGPHPSYPGQHGPPSDHHGPPPPPHPDQHGPPPPHPGQHGPPSDHHGPPPPHLGQHGPLSDHHGPPHPLSNHHGPHPHHDHPPHPFPPPHHHHHHHHHHHSPHSRHHPFFNHSYKTAVELHRVSDDLLEMYGLPRWDEFIVMIDAFYCYIYPSQEYLSPKEIFLKTLNVSSHASLLHAMLLHVLPYIDLRTSYFQGRDMNHNNNNTSNLNEIQLKVFENCKKYWQNMTEASILQCVVLIFHYWANEKWLNNEPLESVLTQELKALLTDALQLIKVLTVQKTGMIENSEVFMNHATKEMVVDKYLQLKSLWGFKNMITLHNWFKLQSEKQSLSFGFVEDTLKQLEHPFEAADKLLSENWDCLIGDISSGATFDLNFPDSDTPLSLSPVPLRKIFELDENDPALEVCITSNLQPGCLYSMLCLVMDSIMYGKPYPKKLEYLKVRASKLLLQVDNQAVRVDASVLTFKSYVLYLYFSEMQHGHANTLLTLMNIMELINLLKLPETYSAKKVTLAPMDTQSLLHWSQYPKVASDVVTKCLNFVQDPAFKIFSIQLTESGESIEINNVQYDLSNVNTGEYTFFENWSDFIQKVRFLNSNVQMLENFQQTIRRV